MYRNKYKNSNNCYFNKNLEMKKGEDGISRNILFYLLYFTRLRVTPNNFLRFIYL